MLKAIVGISVNFPLVGGGGRYDGTIIGAWLEKDGDYPTSVRVVIACTDGYYREAWLANCTSGLLPPPEKGRK